MNGMWLDTNRFRLMSGAVSVHDVPHEYVSSGQLYGVIRSPRPTKPYRSSKLLTIKQYMVVAGIDSRYVAQKGSRAYEYSGTMHTLVNGVLNFVLVPTGVLLHGRMDACVLDGRVGDGLTNIIFHGNDVYISEIRRIADMGTG